MRNMLTIALVLFVPALAMVGYDVYKFTSAVSPTFTFTTFGSLWYSISWQSIDIVRDFCDAHLPPFVWDPVMQQLLLWPAAVVLSIPSTAMFTIWGGHGLIAEDWSGKEFVGNKKQRKAAAKKRKAVERNRRLAERARKRKAMQRYQTQHRRH